MSVRTQPPVCRIALVRPRFFFRFFLDSFFSSPSFFFNSSSGCVGRALACPGKGLSSLWIAMDPQQQLPSISCIPVGDDHVGKVSLVTAGTTSKTIRPDAYAPASFDNAARAVTIGGTVYSLCLMWGGGSDVDDTARATIYSMGSPDVFLVCFSIDDPSSFEHVSTKVRPWGVWQANPDERTVNFLCENARSERSERRWRKRENETQREKIERGSDRSALESNNK